MIDILIPVSLFAMIFGVVYLRTRERLAMIERGMNPSVNDGRPRPFINLKWGLLLVGAGCGLLIAFLINSFVLTGVSPGRHMNPIFLYFALIAIGGGLGLFISYKIEKKEWMDREKLG